MHLVKTKKNYVFSYTLKNLYEKICKNRIKLKIPSGNTYFIKQVLNLQKVESIIFNTTKI